MCYQDFQGASADPGAWWHRPTTRADYTLSKRTDLYLNMAYAINRKDNSRGLVSVVGLGGKDQAVNGQNQFGAVVGVRHKF